MLVTFACHHLREQWISIIFNNSGEDGVIISNSLFLLQCEKRAPILFTSSLSILRWINTCIFRRTDQNRQSTHILPTSHLSL